MHKQNTGRRERNKRTRDNQKTHGKKETTKKRTNIHQVTRGRKTKGNHHHRHHNQNHHRRYHYHNHQDYHQYNCRSPYQRCTKSIYGTSPSGDSLRLVGHVLPALHAPNEIERVRLERGVQGVGDLSRGQSYCLVLHHIAR